MNDPYVLFVPGFLSQLYDSLSTFVLSGHDTAVRGKIEKVLVKLGLPLAEGTGLSFYTQERKLDGLGMRYTNIGRPRVAAFDTQQGVQANGQAIKAKLEELRGQGVRRVVIVSHSKGGLDTLEALLTGEQLWNNPVIGWVALQPPFYGSPIAGPDLSGGANAGGALGKMRAVLNAKIPLAQALEDLTTARREAYMNQREPAIRRLTATIGIRSCYTRYEAEPAKNLIAAVSAGPDLAQVLGAVGLLDAFNLAMSEPNDGLVPMSSTRLPGVVPNELFPSADHAAPVMLTAPLREFWTTANRDDQTLRLLSEVAT